MENDMNAIDALFRWVDTITATSPQKRTMARTRSHGANRGATQAAKHTFTVSAPLCVPIRNVYTELHAVGIRGDWSELPSLTTQQTARLTVSRRQAEYASLLLWKLAAQWTEGLDISGDPWRKKSRAAVVRNGATMPKPWKNNGKAWRQPGCKSG